jgi:PAS domain S-box-containing protein
VTQPDANWNAWLAAVVDSSDDVIVSKTLDGIITSWNRSAERTFGWTAAEAIGQHITLIVPDDRRSEEDEVLARIRRGQKVDHFETVRRAKDGRLVEMSIIISPVKDAAGRIIGAAKVAREITERRRSEVARARLAAVVESSNDVIVSKTLDGIITSWNPTAERTFGWTEAEAIGQHITLIIPEERRAEEEDVLARIRRGERLDHFETVRRAKDGRLIEMSITVSPIMDAAGHIVGASKVARDISERRRLEDQRAQLLAQEQEARKEAEALNTAKDQLIATVSHELRTPLNSILGWTRMIQSGTLDEAASARAMNSIVRNATAQGRLIEDLLDFARVSAGRMRLDFERMDLNAVIEAALETVRPAARAKDITLAANLDHTIGAIAGAPDRLQQVVWNLLMNSVKFTPTGGRVEIASERRADTVAIVVRDTGEGIAADVLPHVFEAFRQEDSSSTRAHGGLGLGLSLVRRLTELHGGEVTAESPGKGLGTNFTVTLPLTGAGAKAVAAEERRSTERVLAGARILVVDDDADFLELSTVILRRAGANVRAASSASRAQEIVNAWLPNVIIMDLAVSEADGFGLVGAMRSLFAERAARVAMIGTTVFGAPENRARAVLAGFDLYLTKPVDPEGLTGAVAEVIPRGS